MEYLQSWKSWLAAILLICGFALQALGAYLGAKTLPNGEVQRGGGRIEVRAALVDGTVEVSVKDTGIGIAPRRSGGGLRGIPASRQGGQEGGRDGSWPRTVPEVRRAAWRADLGHWEPVRRLRSRSLCEPAAEGV
jgi:hypothetical protein